MSQLLTEHVLVVATEWFRSLGYFQGFSSDIDRYLQHLFDPQHTSYRLRAEVEQDSSFKQLIPYVIFRHRDADGQTSLFQYTRGTRLDESRLHGKRSIGVGGHVARDDRISNSEVPYAAAMHRELYEEVIIDTPVEMRCVGLINDDETPVGQVHLGVVHIADVERPIVRPRESELLDAGFRPVKAILADIDRLESWSQICLRNLFQ